MSASLQGTWSPYCAIRQHNAAVLMDTVFPPVLGPVMTTPRIPSPISKSRGTQISFSIRGCLALQRRIFRCVLIFGSTPSISMLSFPLEKIKSSFSIIRIFSCITGAPSAAIAVKVYKIRCTSFSSSIFNNCTSSYILEMLTGSTNRVFPVEDLSTALPGIFHLYSFFTGMHTLPLRRVKKWSAMHSLLERMICSAFCFIFSSKFEISLLISCNNLEA